MADRDLGKPRLSAKGWALGLAVMIVGGFATRELRLSTCQHYQETQRYEDIYYLPPPTWLRVMSLGYREALADLLWMRALVYFGEEVTQAEGMVKHLFEYTDAMLGLDEDFKAVYRWVGVVTFYRAGEFLEEDGWRGVSYLERAVKRWPDDGELAWDLGATLAFEMPPGLKDEEARDAAKQRGLVHMATAARLGHGPPWLALTNASMLGKLGKTEQAIRHLEEAYSTLTDEESRAQVAARLAKLRDERYATAFQQAHRELRERWQKNYPYIGARYDGSKHEGRRDQIPELFLLIGDRESRAYFDMLERGFVPPEEDNILTAEAEPGAGDPPPQ